MSAQLHSTNYTSTNVIPLRGTRIATTPEAGDIQLAGHGTEARFAELVTAIEALSCQLVVEKALRGQQSPFDAVYISALQPDEILASSIAKLRRLARIEDRSHQVTFEDGLE